MERGLVCLFNAMSINLIRFLESQKAKAARYNVECLRYRGVAYKK